MFRTPMKMSSASKDTTLSPQGDGNLTMTLSAAPCTSIPDIDVHTIPSVRQSIGEIEARRTPTPPPQLKNSTSNDKSKTKTTPNSATKTEHQPKTKMAEAKAYFTKAKLHLNSSRNLKTEIKNGILDAIEGLYSLVKEMERGKAQGAIKKPKLDKQTEITELGGERNQVREGDNALLKKIEDHSELIRGNKEELVNLQKAFSAFKTMIQQDVVNSIQEIGRNIKHKSEDHLPKGTITKETCELQKIQIPQIKSHDIIVRSNNDQDTCQDVIVKIRKAVRARTEGTQIDKVRKVGNQKVIISASSAKEIHKIKEQILQSKEELTAEDSKKKHPLIIIKNVLAYNTDEDILESLVTQNSKLVQNIDDEQRKAEVKFRKKTRNPLQEHIILQVNPVFWRILVDAGRVHIDLQQLTVEDYSPLIQCSQCLGYSHPRRWCTEPKEQVCSHCGGQHLRRDCPEVTAGTKPKCRNCERAGIADSGHDAFSKDCPIRTKWEKIARSKVIYC